MKRILSIGQDQIMSGIATGSYIEKGGLWLSAAGMNPFIDAGAPGTLKGLMVASSTPTALTARGLYTAAATRLTAASTGKMYLWGTSGELSSIDLSGDNDTVDLGTAVNVAGNNTNSTAPANGMTIYKATGGTEYLYYTQVDRIGRYDFTTWPATNNWATGLTSTTHHQMHNFLDSVYIADLYRISKIYTVGTTDTFLANVLDFPSNFTVTCLEDDGQYLVIGITTNFGDNVLASDTRILFWDTNSSSWQKEFRLQGVPSITSLRRVGTTIYAICGRQLYAFNFNSEPVFVRNLESANDVNYGNPDGSAVLGQAVIFGDQLTVYGKVIPESGNGFFTPFTGISGDVSLIVTNPYFQKMFVATQTPGLYRFNISTAGTASQWKTVFIDLKARYNIQELTFSLPNKMASGDVIGVTIASPDTTQACTNVSFANQGAVGYVKITPAAALETDMLQLQLTFSGGTPSVKRIDVWGEPVVSQ